MAFVLLVDDEPASLDVIRRALEGDGHRVMALASGGEAIAAVAGGLVIDMLVSDVQMPDIDGPTLAARLRAARPGLPVLLVSAHVADLDRAAAALPGARVLAKPFTVERIRAEVASALA